MSTISNTPTLEGKPADIPATLKAVSDAWRSEENHEHGLTAGFVVVCVRDAVGWIRQLSRADCWMPGSFAVGLEGQIYIADGGDSYNGAERWVAYTPALGGKSVFDRNPETDAAYHQAAQNL